MEGLAVKGLPWRIPGMGEPGGLPSMGAKQETQVQSLDREDSPGEGNGLLSLKFFPGCLILIHIQNNIKSLERRDKLGA